MNPAEELRVAKIRLRTSVAVLDPLRAVRRKPLATLGVACAAGVVAVSLPRTRRALVDAIDIGLGTLARSAGPLVRLALAARQPGGAPARFAAISRAIRAGLRLVDAGLNYSRVDPPGPG